MDFHVITPEAAELVMQVIDGQLVLPLSPVAHPAAPTPSRPPLLVHH
jgi:hypothetical protein